MSLLSGDKIKGVNVLDPRQLFECAQDHSEAGRHQLAQAVSQFFEEKQLTDVEQALASEILLNLIRQAETDLREALSERLSIQENIPSELIVYLANDQISVARHVLQHSPVLNDIDLIYIITARGEEHWQQIAQRDGISPVVVDRLIDTGNPATVLNLIDNQRVNLQKSSMKKMARIALRSEELQAPLLRRPEIDADVAVDLYMVVSEALRREITDRFPVPAHALDQALDGLVHELGNAARGLRDTTPEMLVLAKRFKERGDIPADLLIRTLRRGQFGFFVALFAELTQLPVDCIVRMQQKDGGKPFVVACRHTGMMKSEFASIYLLSRGIRGGDRIVDQRELAMALRNFDTLKEYDVQRIMATWVKNPDMI
jgi:uncharacterized protein (DUF2336 family)